MDVQACTYDRFSLIVVIVAILINVGSAIKTKTQLTSQMICMIVGANRSKMQLNEL